MKILYITSQVPFPPQGGYAIVVHNTLKGILKTGADISLFSLNPRNHFVEIRNIKDALLEQIQFTSSYINSEVTSWGTFKNLLFKKSYSIARFYKASAASHLKNILKENQFDIIQLEGLFVVPYLPVIKQMSQAKIVYRAHNIEYQIWERQAEIEIFPPRRLFLSMLARHLKEYELQNLNQFNAVVTISEADLRELRYQGCKVNMENFSVAVDLADYQPDSSQTENLSVFYLGSMDWAPNQEGLDWFIEYVWQDLQQLDVGLKFHIAGRNIPEELMAYAGKAIKVYSNLEDAKAFMNSKSIMVVPLKAGSGMRVKIIEGMAMKKCIISTSVGAEGIRYEHGKNILIADTADDFYRYILQCTTNQAFTRRIGENARRLIEADHYIEPFSKRLMAFYHKIAQG
ncbi:MAG TPA: glycosyltransferase family 4 protein [Daejeonella sp.]|nr:glycosyltransferase family 4 protein [Daejeonella sp.]